ncbi:MAG TPA: hypothetical protein VGN54_06920 [Mycobacteriales bacterium]|nr:hypothetical protein [Mycobacteriales bacterium]
MITKRRPADGLLLASCWPGSVTPGLHLVASVLPGGNPARATLQHGPLVL